MLTRAQFNLLKKAEAHPLEYPFEETPPADVAMLASPEYKYLKYSHYPVPGTYRVEGDSAYLDDQTEWRQTYSLTKAGRDACHDYSQTWWRLFLNRATLIVALLCFIHGLITELKLP